jgi:hypothetical protein
MRRAETFFKERVLPQIVSNGITGDKEVQSLRGLARAMHPILLSEKNHAPPKGARIRGGGVVSVCRLQRQWLVQFEPQRRFCWHFDGLTACEYLGASSGSRSRNCTDGCTLASAGNCSDKRT